MKRFVLPAVVFLAAGAASPLPAQAIRGSVTDSARSTPLDSAFIELLADGDSVVGYITSNNGGRFYLRAPGPGEYTLRIRHLGYASFRSEPVTLARGRDASLHVRLTPLAVELEPVTVVSPAADRFLQNVGYYERKKASTGYFLDPDVTDKLASRARQTVDVLDGIPGVTIAVAGGSWGIRRPLLTRQMMCDEVGPRIYVDNILVTAGNVPFDLNTLNPIDLLAVEVYDSVSEVPLHYGGTEATCGVLVIWTKR